MILHYDYMAKHFPQRTRDVQRLIDADVLHLGMDHLSEGLVRMGSFPAQAVSQVVQAYHKVQGRQTFEVSPLVAEMLEHTSLEGITAEELRFPYSTFYVALPETEMRIWGGSRTQWHPVGGFYASLDAQSLTIYVWGMENDRSFGRGDDASQWAVLNLHLDGDLESLVTRLLQDDTNRKDDPIIDPIVDIPAMLEGTHQDGLVGEKYNEQMEMLRGCFRIAVNLALYLTTEKPDVEERADKGIAKLRRRVESSTGRKRERFQTMLEQRTVVKRVGHNLACNLAATRAAHGPVRGHWVRGHWRRYWTGPGRKVCERRWILPHPHGIEQPDARTYGV